MQPPGQQGSRRPQETCFPNVSCQQPSYQCCFQASTLPSTCLPNKMENYRHPGGKCFMSCHIFQRQKVQVPDSTTEQKSVGWQCVSLWNPNSENLKPGTDSNFILVWFSLFKTLVKSPLPSNVSCAPAIGLYVMPLLITWGGQARHGYNLNKITCKAIPLPHHFNRAPASKFSSTNTNCFLSAMHKLSKEFKETWN